MNENSDTIRSADPDYPNTWTPEERARRLPGVNRRAAGAIVGMAAGDALGAPYEFGPSPRIVLTGTEADMIGGGAFGWGPGEWTDDTSMALPILRTYAQTALYEWDEAPTRIVRDWKAWARTAKDVGNQTRAVLSALGDDATAEQARNAARAVHQRAGRSGGNGSLMRTAPVGIRARVSPAGFFSPARNLAAVVGSARELSDLTHFDADAGDACVLWSAMIHRAVTYGVVLVDDALLCLPAERRERWAGLLDEARDSLPEAFPNNGWVVHALQAAWAAIHRAGIDLADDRTATPQAFRVAIQHAINAGGDTDTVAAIAGALSGAMCGVDAIPLGWQRMLHGWGGEGVVLRAADLIALAGDMRRNPGYDQEFTYRPVLRVDYSRYGDTRVLARHPHDAGVWIGGVGVLDVLPEGIDAVVSLCRVGSEQVPAAVAAEDRVSVWLIDRAEAGENPHLEFVLAEAADAVAALRAQGKTVLLHCVQAQSRTPTVATLYAARHLGVPMDDALREVCAALPDAHPNAAFRRAFEGFGGAR